MFGDIGLSEFLVVALVALLVVRPEDLPVLMRRAGVLYAHVQMNVQGMWAGFQEQLGLLNAPRREGRHEGKDEA